MSRRNLIRDIEAAHLAVCSVFQSFPVAEIKDGKTFVRLPGFDDILVERIRVN